MTQKLDTETRYDAACYTCDEYERYDLDTVEEMRHFIRTHCGHKVYIAVYKPVESIVEE